MNRGYYTLVLIPFLLLVSLQYMPLFSDIGFATTQISSTNMLQTQLDAAPSEATVMLTDESYTEPISINSPLTLTGDGANATRFTVTSSPNSYAIQITTAYTTVENLIIENHGSGLYTTGIKITAPYVTIKNCTIRNTPVGIAIWADHVLIDNCVFEYCEDEGIAVLGSIHRTISYTTITESIFRNNCDGIELQNALNTTIRDCVFVHHSHAAIDIIGRYNADTLIDSCQISDSTVFDIYLAHTENTTITDSSYASEKLQVYKSSTLRVLGSSAADDEIEESIVRFSAHHYLSQLLERLQHLMKNWEDKITMLNARLTELYKK